MSVFSAVPYFFRLLFLFSPTLPSVFSTGFFRTCLYDPDYDVEKQTHSESHDGIKYNRVSIPESLHPSPSLFLLYIVDFHFCLCYNHSRKDVILCQ